MEFKVAIFCTAAVCCAWMLRVADSQSSTRCLFSRLNNIPCIPHAATIQPGPNEQGIYRTRIGRGPSGGPQCTYINPVRFPNAQIVESINDLGNSNLRVLFSPGFFLEEDYANAMLVTYNVQCPAGRLAFYNAIHLDLQEADCFGRCTDYIEVERCGFGPTESCGNETQDNLFELEEGTFTVTFRTGERTRGRGFVIFIVCFDPLDLDLPDCLGSSDNSTARRERDLGLIEKLMSELFATLSAENNTNRIVARHFISDEAIQDAMHNENSCNPVVRTTSQIVLEIATQQNIFNISDENGSGYTLVFNQTLRCIFSRLDVLPCIPNAATVLPGTNEQGIYKTLIGQGPSGELQCTYRNPNWFPSAQIVEPIIDLGNPNLRVLFSPGFLQEEPYENSMLVTYNVQCPAGRLAFYNLVHLDLQEPDCFDRCTDYIEVERGGFGTTESCGKEPGDNLFQLEEGTFTVTFRTGERTRGRGFVIIFICFDPLELDLPGCLGNGDNSTTRRKRDIGTLDKLMSELIDTLSAANDTNSIIAGHFIRDEAICDAILTENSCNPVVRITSQIILQIATEQNASRVELIRKIINGVQRQLNDKCN